MNTTIYGIKNCDTMKKAFKWLDEHNVDYIFHDYKKSGVPENALNQWIALQGWEAVINKRGTTWRKLPDEVKASMNNEQAVIVAMENPSIIKRPALTNNGDLLLGFTAEAYGEFLK